MLIYNRILKNLWNSMEIKIKYYKRIKFTYKYNSFINKKTYYVLRTYC